MKERVILFKTALSAKLCGFNVPVRKFYSDYDYEGKPCKTGYLFKDQGKISWNNKESFGYISNKEETLWSAPKQALLQKWLRDKHSLHIELENGDLTNRWRYIIYTMGTPNARIYSSNTFEFETYEDALEEALYETLKLICNGGDKKDNDRYE